MNDTQSGEENPQMNNIAEGLPALEHIQEEHPDLDLLLDIQSLEPSAMQVFLVWEKIRLLYNVMLCLIVSCAVLSLKGGFDNRFFGLILIVVFLANAIFSLGPVIEGYLCLFRVSRITARWIGVAAVSFGTLVIAAIPAFT